MGKNKKNIVILVFIILIALIFRTFNLQTIPPHITLDEASIGYNAYSILKTGADEYGSKFPILLRAYDDYRPALYTYIVIPFIKVFGLNVIAIRLPSVLLSVGVIISVYFLTRQFFSKHKIAEKIAFMTGLVLALSPWHIYISRLGHEVNLFFSAFIFGVTFFYIFLDKKKWYFLLLASAFFAVSFIAYQSGKIFIPIILLVLLILYHKELLKNKILTLISLVLFFIIVVPTLLASLAPQAMIRFQATNIYTMANPLLEKSAQNVLKAKQDEDYLGQVLNNRRLVYVALPLQAYISHFNPFWLFSNGSDEPFKAPFLGLLYPYDLPLILIGLLSFTRTKAIPRKTKIFILVWTFSAIIPAAITNGFPHAMRIFQILPMPQIFIALGLFVCCSQFKSRKLLIGILLAYIIVSSVILSKTYFEKLPLLGNHFQDGVSQALSFAIENQHNYEKIYVSNSKNLFESYMFYLFVAKYDPFKYQNAGGTVSGGFAEEHVIGKFNFVNLSKQKQMKGLIIANPGEVSGKVVKKIYFKNGHEALWIVRK